jgi:hypothetical protein
VGSPVSAARTYPSLSLKGWDILNIVISSQISL